MSTSNLQIGYHGCDISVRDGLISGALAPEQSNNQYDWLGPGFYLFEGDQDRALAFAQAAASQPFRRLTAKPIFTPAVVACVYSVPRCLDMTTGAGRLEYENAYLSLQAARLRSGERIPLNLQVHPRDDEVLLRGLDRAVLEFIHSRYELTDGFGYFQAVRGAFRQGPELAPRSGFHRDSHIQIAVRDMSCIKGWFLPPGTRQLSQQELMAAQAALRSARDANPKARLRSMTEQ